MLLKKTQPFSQKLRIIQLFEGDFNAGLKYLIGRRLMWHITNFNLMDEEVYGSMVGKTGLEALTSLYLLADHSRTWKKYLALIFNDADGCFDMIPPLLETIALRRIGYPLSITKAHIKVQENINIS